MAKHVYIQDIAGHVGKDVTLKGWLYNSRSGGKLHFLQLRDGTGTIQCVVFEKDVPPEVFRHAGALTQESSIIVTGAVRQDKRSSIGFEIGVKDLKIMQKAENYPISPKEHGTGFLMDKRHLWLRSSRQHAILRVRAEIVRAVREYFDSNGFTLIDAPIFTPAACEGTTTLFETDYFGQKAYLTQSGQLYMEAAAMAFGKVYCFGPTFRSEKSKTRRHLTEFWMVEPEMAYFDLNDDMDLAEDFVLFIVQSVAKKCRAELKVLKRDPAILEKISKPFPRISYDEALAILEKNGAHVEWGDDFGGDEETILSSRFDRPVIVHRYPARCKAFYMKNDPENAKLALCMDMLAPEGHGEIIGGGQREDSYRVLLEKIRRNKLPEDAFEWYLDLRKYGTVPHSGFGLGIERTLSWICGLPHVRETIPFPRLLDRLKP